MIPSLSPPPYRPPCLTQLGAARSPLIGPRRLFTSFSWVSGPSHLAGGFPSNTWVSHHTEAVLRDSYLGTIGKHDLRRTTSNPNCDAAGNWAGLGTVEKNGLHRPTSNPLMPLRSGRAGTNNYTVSGCPHSYRAERKARSEIPASKPTGRLQVLGLGDLQLL